MSKFQSNLRAHLAAGTQRFLQKTKKINQLFNSTVRTGKYLWHLSSSASKSFFKEYISFIAFICCISLCLFFLVKVRIETYRLGYRIVQLKNEKSHLEEHLKTLRLEHARLRSYTNLVQLNSAMGLYLLPPENWISDK